MKFSRLFGGLLCCVAASLAQSAPRLISGSPEVTELLFQLGKGGDVIATPEYSEFPAAARKLPVLGPLFAPSVERTARLAPDWVVLDSANLSETYVRALSALHVPSVLLDLSRVENVFTESRRLLNLVYRQPPSAALDAYERCWRAFPTTGQPKRFLAFVWLSPPILIGRGTYLSDLLEHAAGTNALPEKLRLPYPQVSEDWLASRPPDKIFLLNSIGTPEAQARELFRKWWPGWQGSVTYLDGDTFSRSTLTPLRHLSRLNADLPKECRELP